MGLFSNSGGHASAAQLARIERKLDALLDFLQVEMPVDGMEDIRAMAAAGNKIGAIKAYRERTGVGLAEAKEAVERGCERPG
ncbi:MAG: ribosomal protein L7/L12 [Phycisphaeraceae bacterium]|nr:ribosomal protein L7/L12 [Phycisphaeraceae bacterium]